MTTDTSTPANKPAAKTAGEIKKARIQKATSQGLVYLEVCVPLEHKDHIKHYAKKLVATKLASDTQGVS